MTGPDRKRNLLHAESCGVAHWLASEGEMKQHSRRAPSPLTWMRITTLLCVSSMNEVVFLNMLLLLIKLYSPLFLLSFVIHLNSLSSVYLCPYCIPSIRWGQRWSGLSEPRRPLSRIRRPAGIAQRLIGWIMGVLPPLVFVLSAVNWIQRLSNVEIPVLVI